MIIGIIILQTEWISGQTVRKCSFFWMHLGLSSTQWKSCQCFNLKTICRPLFWLKPSFNSISLLCWQGNKISVSQYQRVRLYLNLMSACAAFPRCLREGIFCDLHNLEPILHFTILWPILLAALSFWRFKERSKDPGKYINLSTKP